MALYKMVYVDGNVVRQTHVMDLADREEREYEQHRRWLKKKRDRLWAHRKQKCESKFYVCGMTLRLVIIGVVLTAYIHVQNDISMHLGNISNLERQVSELKKDNEVMVKRLSLKDNIISIQEKAKSVYGMDYATKDQIVFYSLDKQDHVDQLREVK